MDWSKQLQETIKTWTDSQMRLTDGVGKVMQRMATPPSSNPWEFSVDLWEKGVGSFLEAEDDWSRLWLRGVGTITRKPDQDDEVTRRLREMTQLSFEFQKKFWENWFLALKHIDPVKNAKWLNELKPLADGWTENMHRSIQLQEEWLQSAIRARASQPES